MGRNYILSLTLVTILLLGSSSTFAQQYQPPHNKPGPAADKIRFKAFAVEIAPVALEKGDMDIYFFSLKTATAKELLGRPGSLIYQAPASMVSIILNPAPAPPREFNPLSVREVRFALQYIVNRDFIAGEIYRGLGLSMLTHVSPIDFDYLNVNEIVKKSGIRYDPELAKRLVNEAMTKAGAVLRDGKWTFGNSPIRLKFIIRIEDERREVGDLVSAELEKLGFQIERVYQQFGPAIQKVYGTDPKLFEWHLYTEGWGRGATEKFDFSSINQMCAPWLGNMPGWQEFGFWQYTNPQIDETGQRIFKGEFTNQDQRNQLYKQTTEACLIESVRLWAVTVVNNFPSSPQVKGITGDATAGPKSVFTLREAHIPGKSELVVGSLWVWTERSTWNPVGGFGDVYSIDIFNVIRDPLTWRHPFSGLPIPFRVQFKVETSGPGGKMDIPRDAVSWEAKGGRWESLPSGAKATSKVTYNFEKFFNSKWHHGQPITMADFIYGVYQAFDIAYNEQKSKIEISIATTSKPFLETIKAIRIVDDKTLEVYTDFWHFVPDFIADYAQPASLGMPWEILYAMDDMVFTRRTGAYTDTASERFQVPWISLVQDRDSRLVRRSMADFLDKGIFPEKVFTIGGKNLVNKEEALRRYRAAMEWFEKNKNFVISNGPFMLTSFDPASQFAEVQAFRDPNYPFKPGDWFFGFPTPTEIVGVKGDQITLGSDTAVEVEVRGKGTLGMKFLLFDPTKGSIIMKDDAKKVSPNRFVIEIPSRITGQLQQGSYQLFIFAFSEEISVVAERVHIMDARRVAVVATPTPTPTQTPATTPTPTPTSPVTPTPTPTSPTIPRPTPPRQDYTIIFVAIGVAVAVVVGVVIFLRRQSGTPKAGAGGAGPPPIQAGNPKESVPWV